MTENTLSRSLHDLGLAAWFGGTLADAVALNPAAAEATSAGDSGAVANVGWDRWTPVNAAAIGAHLLGSVVLTGGNKGRIAGQKGVASTAIAKTAVTAGALAATAYARALGPKVIDAGDVPVEGGTDPSAETPPEVAGAQRKLNALQWAIPALTGTLLVMDALMGEQQRANQVSSGFVQRLLPDSLAA